MHEILSWMEEEKGTIFDEKADFIEKFVRYFNGRSDQ